MPGKISEDSFGQTKDGKKVTRFTLENSTGSLVVRILDYGGIITEIIVPDKNGDKADINLGFDNMEGYESGSPYFGAIIGRVANRIAGGTFTLDGQSYSLAVNNGPNSLHGGNIGFDKKIWSSKVNGDELILQCVSPDRDENYPGELTTTVTYKVTDNELSIQYEATTTKATPVNLTNHAYFNLAGHDAGNIEDHEITIVAESVLPLDENSIPKGDTLCVEGTKWDLRTPVRLGDCLKEVPGGIGFDINFCLPSNEGKLQLAARVFDKKTNRFLECWTTEPGMQLYTSYYLDVPKGKGGAVYKQFGAFCLEAQHYPDSVNQPSFPSIILKPNDTYRQTTIYKFGVA